MSTCEIPFLCQGLFLTSSSDSILPPALFTTVTSFSYQQSRGFSDELLILLLEYLNYVIETFPLAYGATNQISYSHL